MLRVLLIMMGLFPAFLSAQNTPSASDVLAPHRVKDQPLRERLFRLGLTFKADAMRDLDRRWVADDLVSWQTRRPVVAAALDWQPLAKVSHILLVMEVSFQKDRFETTSDAVSGPQPTFYLAGFQEDVQYHRWQLSPGIRIDLLPRYSIAPFISTKLLFDVPTQMKYHFRSVGATNFFAPALVDIEGGAKVNMGWEFSAGLRVRLAQVLHLSLAYYHTELNIGVDWPPMEFLYLGDTILTFKNPGFLMSLQYEL